MTGDPESRNSAETQIATLRARSRKLALAAAVLVVGFVMVAFAALLLAGLDFQSGAGRAEGGGSEPPLLLTALLCGLLLLSALGCGISAWKAARSAERLSAETLEAKLGDWQAPGS